MIRPCLLARVKEWRVLLGFGISEGSSDMFAAITALASPGQVFENALTTGLSGLGVIDGEGVGGDSRGMGQVGAKLLVERGEIDIFQLGKLDHGLEPIDVMLLDRVFVLH